MNIKLSCAAVGLALVLLRCEAGKPPAPPGCEWQVLPALFDEFNRAGLNPGKWLKYHPNRSGWDSASTTNNVWLT